MSSVENKLKSFNEGLKSRTNEFNDKYRSSVFDNSVQEMKTQLSHDVKYRTKILNNISVFEGLNHETIASAARFLQVKYYRRGDLIIKENTIGDTFYLLEKGTVEVLRRKDPNNENEVPQKLAELTDNSYFGEIALLTAELRSASIRVISKVAKCLYMTKDTFNELIKGVNEILDKKRRAMADEVLKVTNPFKSLKHGLRTQLLELMTSVTYSPNTYLCRQGATSHSYYIITEGQASVRVASVDNDNVEEEVAVIGAGTQHGESALGTVVGRRNASIMAIETVGCLVLSRSDFLQFLEKMNYCVSPDNLLVPGTWKIETDKGLAQNSYLARKRRISALGTHGQKDSNRALTLLRRYSMFAVQSLWNSLYARLYRDLLVRKEKVAEYGRLAHILMRNSEDRIETVQNIRKFVSKITKKTPDKRTPHDHKFIYGLLSQRNYLRDNLCKSWSNAQFLRLTKAVNFKSVSLFTTFVDTSREPLTCAYLILRGAVSISYIMYL